MPSLPIQPTAYRVTATGVAALVITSVDRYETAFLIRNTDATLSVFLGDSAVTVGTGYEVRAGEAVALGLGDLQSIYGITAGANVVLDIIERVSQ